MNIDITNADLVKFVQAVYDLSEPQGMGFLHFQPEPLTDTDAESLIQKTGSMVISMDYVKGRSCKMNVHRDLDGKLWFRAPWYDHTERQLQELLKRAGVSAVIEKLEHGVACNCDECVRLHGRS